MLGGGRLYPLVSSMVSYVMMEILYDDCYFNYHQQNPSGCLHPMVISLMSFILDFVICGQILGFDDGNTIPYDIAISTIISRIFNTVFTNLYKLLKKKLINRGKCISRIQ